MPKGIYKRIKGVNCGKKLLPQCGFQNGHKLGNRFKKGYIPWNKGLLGLKRLGNTGENHWRWIKNREILERNLRNDPEYLQWVKKVKKRDNNICQSKDQNCSGYNIAHHIKSWSEYPELRYKVSNGITLCQAHHPRKRAEEKRLILFFMELVSVSNDLICH